MKGFITGVFLLVTLFTTVSNHAQETLYLYCQDCRNADYPQDFGNEAVNAFFSDNSFLQFTPNQEVYIVSDSGLTLLVQIDIISFPINDFWDEAPGYSTPANDMISVKVMDGYAILANYDLDMDMINSLGAAPVGAPTPSQPPGCNDCGPGNDSDSGSDSGEGPGDGPGTSDGAGFGGGPLFGGGGAGISGCTVTHTENETILICYLN